MLRHVAHTDLVLLGPAGVARRARRPAISSFSRECGSAAAGRPMKTAPGEPEAVAQIVQRQRIYFSSTDQYALSRNVFHDWYFRCVSLRFRSGLRRGFSGLRIRLMWACFGVRPPFLTLQFTQAQTMLSQVLEPPWLRGITWSRLSSLVGNFRPQYWHWLLSRAKMFRRLNFTVCFGSLS